MDRGNDRKRGSNARLGYRNPVVDHVVWKELYFVVPKARIA